MFNGNAAEPIDNFFIYLVSIQSSYGYWRQDIMAYWPCILSYVLP